MAYLKALIVSICIVNLVLIYSSSACTPAEQSKCKLPNCLCPSLSIPGNLLAAEIPQIVFLTFDDAVSVINYRFYEDLFFQRKNPNNAFISATFFITHDYTNYTMIHDLYRKGNEIALHSITHQVGTDYWKSLNSSMWRWEVADQRGQVAHFAKIDKSQIKGLRAPFLQTGGDVMMDILYDEGLEYDCSRPTRNYVDPALWPYTTEYNQRFQDCQIEPCSLQSYPGFWIVPMVDYTGDNGEPCAMLDTCIPTPETVEDTLSLLKRNFERHYNRNKAPFGVFTHSAWMTGVDDPPKNRLEGYRQFLDYLGTKNDVYIVSIAKGLDWIRRPTKLADLGTLTSWLPKPELPNSCTIRTNCKFLPDQTPFPIERFMEICQNCPRSYPWLKNPYGIS